MTLLAKNKEVIAPRAKYFTTTELLALTNCCKYIYEDENGYHYSYVYHKVWKYVVPVKTYRLIK